MPAEHHGARKQVGFWLAIAFVFFATCSGRSPAQTDSSPTPEQAALLGKPIARIAFEGVDSARLTPLPAPLAGLIGKPLTADLAATALRAVYATGLFDSASAEATLDPAGVVLTFTGEPRMFIGTVWVDGARGATLNTQLQRASRLSAGNRLTKTSVQNAIALMRQVLVDNGYRESTITPTLKPHPEAQLVDIDFKIVSGPQAHVGSVVLSGDAGMSAEAFRRAAHLKAGARVDRDTASRALNGVLKHYRSENRLEAEIKLESQTYDPATHRIDYHFSANRGPLVRLTLSGASLSDERLRRAIPIYEEGTVDDDLLNEGDRRLRDYYQRLGYFSVKVEHQRIAPGSNDVNIAYSVTLGPRSRVDTVSVDGNHYFDTATLKDLLSVHAADTIDRHGLYSQALVSADADSLKGVYQNNGFSAVRITSETNLASQAAGNPPPGKHKVIGLAVIYHIEEGAQQRVGQVTLEGNSHIAPPDLTPLMNTASGQLFSPQNVAGDRDALLTYYLSHGFDRAQIDVTQTQQAANPNLVDVTFKITEGEQVFVRDVHVTGLYFTRPDTVSRAITLHPGDPLSQSAIAETQRNLYDLALFNEVETAVQNPNSAENRKTVLVQIAEARRWTFTYGFGFETQTGTPQNNCAGYIATGTQCSPNGKTGISPRILGDLTRNNLFGREQSASAQGTYGLLEQRLNLIYQNPHFIGHPNFALSFTGGYANSKDVATYVASKLDAGLRVTQHLSGGRGLLARANTFVYEFDFRRVKVQGSSLQVFPAEIPMLSAAVRVAGPGVTWIRDTRDSALDAHRGTYTSFQEFASVHTFGSQAQFNRLDLSNSSFFSFLKDRFVLARNTRYAQERAFGEAADELIPLPERLYSGGPTSHRGFGVNAAGPRDPETGYPIGGAGALVNSTELRLPPPTLPWLGNSVSFVLFEDMGNVFANASDAWSSAIRIHQPNRDACKVTTQGSVDNQPTPTGPTTSTGPTGNCSFNYFSHAPGIGLRYHTPVGPIRLDFSYNLNPPIYPVNINYSQSDPYANPHVGQAQHFNFVFSLGQTF